MRKIILTIGLLLLLTSCASFLNKKQLSNTVEYSNYKNGILTSDKPMWKLKPSPEVVVRRMSFSSNYIPSPSCSTMLVGVNPIGETEEIAFTHVYGDKRQLSTNAKEYLSKRWIPTKNNPDRLPAVVKIETFSYQDDRKLPTEFKENCSEYF